MDVLAMRLKIVHYPHEGQREDVNIGRSWQHVIQAGLRAAAPLKLVDNQVKYRYFCCYFLNAREISFCCNPFRINSLSVLLPLV